MILRYRYRAYPNKTQQALLEQYFGCARVVYNDALALSIKHYEETGETLSAYDLRKIVLTEAKKTEERKWLGDAPYTCLNASVLNLGKAYANFFRRLKKGEKPGFPKFKKKASKQSISFQNTEAKISKFKINFIKLGNVKINLDRKLPSKYKTVTIIKEPDNKYYISFVVEDSRIIEDSITKAIGLDLGLTNLIITSDGDKFDNPRNLRKAERKLKRLQKSHSRKQKGSANKEKARVKLAKAHKRVSNLRNENLHRITKQLINENQVIAVEDLNVNGMLKNHKLAKAIQDASWSELVRQLEYKCELYGRQLVKVDRFFPSSQLCSDCGLNSGKKDLSIRYWTCECGIEHDRDINAAQNILQEALK